MSTPRKRARDGCWTCKLRHQKCDGARPKCVNCQQTDRECGGFEVRLQWGNGVASRGKLTGALQPVLAEAEARRPARRGRRRDMQRHARTPPAETADAGTRPRDASVQSVLDTEAVVGSQMSISEGILVDPHTDLRPHLQMSLDTGHHISLLSYTHTDLQVYDDSTLWPPTPCGADNAATLSPHSPDERALFEECESAGPYRPVC